MGMEIGSPHTDLAYLSTHSANADGAKPCSVGARAALRTCGNRAVPGRAAACCPAGATRSSAGGSGCWRWSGSHASGPWKKGVEEVHKNIRFDIVGVLTKYDKILGNMIRYFHHPIPYFNGFNQLWNVWWVCDNGEMVENENPEQSGDDLWSCFAVI